MSIPIPGHTFRHRAHLLPKHVVSFRIGIFSPLIFVICMDRVGHTSSHIPQPVQREFSTVNFILFFSYSLTKPYCIVLIL